MTKNVLILDDHPFLRMGVRTFIEKNFDDINCIEAETVQGAEEVLKNTNLDFALVDISLGSEDGLLFAEVIKQSQPVCRVIVLSMHKEPLLIRKAREMGLDGYLIKEDAFSSMKEIFSKESSTGFFLSKRLSEIVSISGESEAAGSLMSMYNSLTMREQTVFRLLADGHNYKAVGVELGINKKTVLVHRYNLIRKMKLYDQTEIVKCALQLGLIDPVG